MLQASLLLLACGLCLHMWSINASVLRTLIGLTSLGVIFYIAIVIAGMSSYVCPFQTPVSIALRGPWKKVRRGIVSVFHSKWVLSWTHRTWNQNTRPLLRRQSLPILPLEDVQVQQSESLSKLHNTSQPDSLSMPNDTPQPESSLMLHSAFAFEPWFKPKDLVIICRTNTSDIGCVSWILKNITDPEALDAAIRLAGEIRWFDDGTNVDLPYDLIVSTFKVCFDSTRTLYPGSRDRAYYAGRAMMWIHTLAMCKSKEFASTFPLPHVKYTTPVPDPDLGHLLWINQAWSTRFGSLYLLFFTLESSPSHSQWFSNTLLHYFWANWTKLDHQDILLWVSVINVTDHTIPLNVMLNRLLVWCTFLRLPIEEEALKVQDKSYGISCSCSSSCSLFLHQ